MKVHAEPVLHCFFFEIYVRDVCALFMVFSVLEANSVGLPVVAYNVPGLVDSIKDSKSGFLIDNGDENSYARAIIKLLMDTKLRCQMSQDAIFWANNFSWDRSAVEFESLLKLAVRP